MTPRILLLTLAMSTMAADCSPSVPEADSLRVEAKAVETGKRLKIRLSVVNATDRPQEVWLPSLRCTNERWKTNLPGVFVHDFALAHTKTCMIKCEHKRTLAPGERWNEEVVLSFFPHSAGKANVTGRQKLQFTFQQPDLHPLDDTPNGDVSPYVTYRTKPIPVVIRPEWWSR